jgi:hypothetical protein
MIGPSFRSECEAAGVTDWRFSYGSDGVIQFHSEVSQAERDKVLAVKAAHNPLPLSQDTRAGLAIDAVDRLQFEIAFDMENRMRAREGLSAVTKSQYRTALINRWKQLNP